jgi:catechol 2,3-dioxygenase-like lactoylglutathione lyase family enzyme
MATLALMIKADGAIPVHADANNGPLNLLSGFNHVATITNDSERLHAFYREVFGAEVVRDGAEFADRPGPRLSVIRIGPDSELNVFQVEGNTEADRQTPMFGRGRIDHLALQASSLANFEELRARLMARGAADDFVTDFGQILSVFFRDPDGLECELVIPNPDAVSGTSNPPGTRAVRYPGA